ncbi:hypothetical protein L3556_07275 [Candidatus Synechococcus calcipolaris G9]|uniref:Uncharacterized protein n=1 Tax=Candidatus Synechococcus calcipolaris G9 TaxID=1497997 RepID=A0ABT6EY44_9SYNE|nr:hypothetical protein [Candidatus Synechococcus calcipolaris]MDG2990732.1 hypothetical protein [Candidatus Synechococcus calcipolaris G9]
MSEPTLEQLKAFYRVVYQLVRLSTVIVFVELPEDKSLYVYTTRNDAPRSRSILFINPDGEIGYV